jgi:hypothetical protein
MCNEKFDNFSDFIARGFCLGIIRIYHVKHGFEWQTVEWNSLIEKLFNFSPKTKFACVVSSLISLDKNC